MILRRSSVGGRISFYTDTLNNQTTKDDILKFYGVYMIPPKPANERKLPKIPQIQTFQLDLDYVDEGCFKKLKEIQKHGWWSVMIRCVKFSLHFITVMLLLFLGAMVFAAIEDPITDKNIDSHPKVEEVTKREHLKYGNKTLLWKYLQRKYDIRLNESDQNSLLGDLDFFFDAVKDVENKIIYQTQVEDRRFIFTKWFYFATISTTTIGKMFLILPVVRH